MQDSRNVILAIVLSVAVLFGWQYFVVGPRMEQAQQEAATQQQAQGAQETNALPTVSADGTAAAPAPAETATTNFADRAQTIASQPRVKIDTPALAGSINLIGGRIDDLELKGYHETVDDSSPIITLLSPAGTEGAYFTEQGWVNPNGSSVALPGTQTEWQLESGGTLTAATPVTLKWDNGQGQVFRRTIAVDEDYLFTVTQAVENTAADAITLYPYSRVVRHGTPSVHNFFVQHEGPLGVLGDNNLVSLKYSDLEKEQQVDASATGGWVGITDKYWATTVLPETNETINARFSWSRPAGLDIYQTSFVGTDAVAVAPGATGQAKSYVFAGAKEEAVIARYESEYQFDRLELLIDWGWLYFLTKPLFWLLRALYEVVGNFGIAILAVTVIVKAIFFPLASRSYASMANMRRVQPELKVIQEKYKDDRAEQQKQMMALYSREKINPLSGCWPMLIQIPVFFALYTVLFISLEMRHAPFFGWIQDLAAPDPTHVFNLFGLLPYDPSAIPVIGTFLAIGIWPIIMGITMWVQMKLNPPPPDPSQAMIFNLMPIIFTFMLGTFPAGLVIYWAWNNFLSIIQQWVIMKRHGVEVDLFGNILKSLGFGKTAEDKTGN